MKGAKPEQPSIIKNAQAETLRDKPAERTAGTVARKDATKWPPRTLSLAAM